MTQQPSVGQAS